MATRPLVVAVGVIVALLVAIAVVAAVGARGTAGASGDAAVGGCVVVQDRGNGAVAVDTVGCTGEGMTFYVASRTERRSSCPGGTGASIVATSVRISVGDATLCLVPDLRAGRCYLLPTPTAAPSAGHVARYERKGCSTVSGASDSPIYAVTRRADGTSVLRCAAGEVAWGTTRPRPIAYCLAPTTAR
ncbi:hypothetical protein GCM10009722_10200 [Williamsia deligens]